MIYIETLTHGAVGVATCYFNEKNYTAEGRTIANALSNLCSRMSRVKGAKGQPWKCMQDNLSGVIGETTKTGRRSSVSDLAGFQLIGGGMNESIRK